MRSKLKKLDAVYLSIMLILLSSAVTTARETCIAGYDMYKEAVQEISIDDKISEIKQDVDFVSLHKVPQSFLDAIVSVEDHRFYQHDGFDIISIGRAAVSTPAT